MQNKDDELKEKLANVEKHLTEENEELVSQLQNSQDELMVYL